LLPRDHPVRYLGSFPTRRSSDLEAEVLGEDVHAVVVRPSEADLELPRQVSLAVDRLLDRPGRADVEPIYGKANLPRKFKIGFARSEEHTSELQSPYDVVCRLLL